MEGPVLKLQDPWPIVQPRLIASFVGHNPFLYSLLDHHPVTVVFRVTQKVKLINPFGLPRASIYTWLLQQLPPRETLGWQSESPNLQSPVKMSCRQSDYKNKRERDGAMGYWLTHSSWVSQSLRSWKDRNSQDLEGGQSRTFQSIPGTLNTQNAFSKDSQTSFQTVIYVFRRKFPTRRRMCAKNNNKLENCSDISFVF